MNKNFSGKQSSGYSIIYNAKDATHLSKIEKELFSIDKRIYFLEGAEAFCDNVQGYMVNKERIYFHPLFPNPSHEVAHMVEMNNLERCIQNDWGLPQRTLAYGPKNNYRSYLAALSREIRVRAIQHHLNNPINIINSTRTNITDYIELFGNLGKFKSFSEVQDWANYLQEQTYCAWSVERIVHEWRCKFDYIFNWMETKSFQKVG